MKRVKVAVIGAGYWGPNLIRNLSEIPEADLTMVVELRPERRAHIHERYPNLCVTDKLEDLLNSDVEAVAIATGASTHHDLALACLGAGKNILV